MGVYTQTLDLVICDLLGISCHFITDYCIYLKLEVSRLTLIIRFHDIHGHIPHMGKFWSGINWQIW